MTVSLWHPKHLPPKQNLPFFLGADLNSSWSPKGQQVRLLGTETRLSPLQVSTWSPHLRQEAGCCCGCCCGCRWATVVVAAPSPRADRRGSTRNPPAAPGSPPIFSLPPRGGLGQCCNDSLELNEIHHRPKQRPSLPMRLSTQ